MRLSKAGYGTVREILDMEADLVLSVVGYEDFLTKYEKAFIELNRGDKSSN
jgi:hypothetical protein